MQLPVSIAIFIVSTLGLGSCALADAELFHVTKETVPKFIAIEMRPRVDGPTRFDIVLRRDSTLIPSTAHVQILDGKRIRFSAFLFVQKQQTKDEWRTFVSIDDQLLKQCRVLLNYVNTTEEQVGRG